MKGNEEEETRHNFVIRRCYMHPSGRTSNSDHFAKFRQSFVRDGWEVIDTPPLTNQGKTSADTHIVMDVLDAVVQFPHVGEYVIMAADADYTPLIIRLRKHMKTTVIYGPAAMSVAYRAACDSIIDERSMLDLLQEEDEQPESVPHVPVGEATPDRVRDAVARYFSSRSLGIRLTWQRSDICLLLNFQILRKGGLGFLRLANYSEKLVVSPCKRLRTEPWLGRKASHKTERS